MSKMSNTKESYTEGHPEDHYVVALTDLAQNMNEKSNTSLIVACKRNHEDHVKILLSSNLDDVNHVNIHGESALFAAIRNENECIVIALVEAGSSVNIQNNSGDSPLMVACGVKNLNIVKILLHQDADVGLINDRNETALLIAITRCSVPILELLASRAGSSVVNFQLENGNTPLMEACRENAGLQIVQVLLDNHARVDMTNNCHENSLYMAIRSGNTEVVKILLDAGCTVNIENRDGTTPLIQACKQNLDVRTITDIISKCHVDYINKTSVVSENALMKVVRHGNTEIVRRLIDTGCNVDVLNNVGCTPLLVACEKNFTEIAIALIDKCDKDYINITCLENENALMKAVRNGNSDLVRRLIAAGCSMDMRNDSGYTPLLVACGNDSTDIAIMLIENHVDVNTLGPENENALFSAVSNNNACVVKSLIEAGIDVDAICNVGITPLTQSVLYSNHDIAKILIDANCDVNGEATVLSPLMSAGLGKGDALLKTLIGTQCDDSNGHPSDTLNSKQRMVSSLVEAGADVSRVSYHGVTPLIAAVDAQAVNESIVTSLLNSKGINVNYVYDNGTSKMSAIHFAAARGHVQCIKSLIARGACAAGTAEYCGEDSWTLAHFAAAFGHTELLLYVKNELTDIIDIKAVNSAGKSPLDLALEKCNRGAVEILLTELPETASGPTLWHGDEKKSDNACESNRTESDSEKSGHQYSQSIDIPYRMKHPCGLIIVVNNKTFHRLGRRVGSDKDVERIVTMFSKLDFQVKVHTDLTATKIEDCFEHYRRQRLKQFSCIFVFVMSHGLQNHICGVDGNSVPIIDITSKFKAERCTNLRGKPKCFFFVACQTTTHKMVDGRSNVGANTPGNQTEDTLSRDASSGFPAQSKTGEIQVNYIPADEKDFYVVYSTTPGQSSCRTVNGTPFVQLLIEKIDKYIPKGRCITEIVKSLNKHMTKKHSQSSLAFESLRKKVVLQNDVTGSRRREEVHEFDTNYVTSSLPNERPDTGATAATASHLGTITEYLEVEDDELVTTSDALQQRVQEDMNLHVIQEPAARSSDSDYTGDSEHHSDDFKKLESFAQQKTKRKIKRKRPVFARARGRPEYSATRGSRGGSTAGSH